MLVDGWPGNAPGAGALADVGGMGEVLGRFFEPIERGVGCCGPLVACGLAARVGNDAGLCDGLFERCDGEFGFTDSELGVSEHGEWRALVPDDELVAVECHRLLGEPESLGDRAAKGRDLRVHAQEKGSQP